MHKNLVLDIDGVLLRDRRLMKHVKENCVRYVAEKLPCCKNPRVTNESLYKAIGHTAYGLSKILQVDTADFNYKVYDASLMDHLAEVISGPLFQMEALKLHNLTLDGWTITLFTNAPPIWATPVALAINDTVKIKCPNGFYKPEAKAYIDFPKNQPKIFVDDSLKNLETLRHDPSWTLLYFGEQEYTWCTSVHTIKDIYNYVREFDQKNFILF